VSSSAAGRLCIVVAKLPDKAVPPWAGFTAELLRGIGGTDAALTDRLADAYTAAGVARLALWQAGDGISQPHPLTLLLERRSMTYDGSPVLLHGTSRKLPVLGIALPNRATGNIDVYSYSRLESYVAGIGAERIAPGISNLPAHAGVGFDGQEPIVTSTCVGGAADDAGVVPGDVLLRMDGVPLTTAAQWTAALGRHAPGDSVQLELRHHGDVRSLKLRLRYRLLGGC
jgi:hypothetical protein